MQCRRPFGAAVPPFGGITRPPAGGGQASAGLAAGGNGAARHGAAGTVPGGHGASIEARFHQARHLVPAKAGTVSRRPGPAGGTQSLKARNPSKSATSQGTQSLSPQFVKVRNPSRHAIRPGTQSVSPHPGGGTAGPIGPAEWCRQSAARFLVPPNGAAQNRLAKARLKTGGGPAARPADRPGGMVPPIGGTVRCRAIARHGVWCLQLQARYPVAPCRPAQSFVPHFLAASVAFVGVGCSICCPGCRISWRPVSHLFLCVRVLARAARFPGGRREAMPSFGGMRRRPIGRRKRCRQTWCRQSATRFLAARFRPAGIVRRLADRVGRAADGGRSELGILRPGMRMSGNAEPGNAEPGDCPPAQLGRRERCRAIARHGAAFWQHLPPPEFRRRPAEPPADRPAAEGRGIACGRTLRRPGVGTPVGVPVCCRPAGRQVPPGLRAGRMRAGRYGAA